MLIILLSNACIQLLTLVNTITKTLIVERIMSEIIYINYEFREHELYARLGFQAFGSKIKN